MSGDQVVEAEVVEEETVPAAEMAPRAEESHSTALEVRPASREVLMPMDTEQVIAGMKAYQQLLQGLLDASDWQGTGDDKFLKKSGWRKIARAFNLSVTRVSSKIERDHDGNPIRAEVVARAMAPNGQVQDGDGYCSVDEPRFASAKGRQKLENDLRATATTRAKNRAISDLVGMGEVSAEEVDAGPTMPLASEQQTGTLGAALNWLLPPAEAAKAWDAIRAQGGGAMLGPVVNAVILTIKARKDSEEAPPTADGLDDETFKRLQGGLRTLNLGYAEINDTLASVGAPVAQAETTEAVDAALRALTMDQAVKVDAHLEKVQQDRSAEAPDPEPREVKPLPASDLPEPDWDGLARGEASNA